MLTQPFYLCAGDHDFLCALVRITSLIMPYRHADCMRIFCCSFFANRVWRGAFISLHRAMMDGIVDDAYT